MEGCAKLYAALTLSGLFFVAEIIASHVTHSLVLLIYSYQMLYNVLALVLLVISYHVRESRHLIPGSHCTPRGRMLTWPLVRLRLLSWFCELSQVIVFQLKVTSSASYTHHLKRKLRFKIKAINAQNVWCCAVKPHDDRLALSEVLTWLFLFGGHMLLNKRTSCFLQVPTFFEATTAWQCRLYEANSGAGQEYDLKDAIFSLRKGLRHTCWLSLPLNEDILGPYSWGHISDTMRCVGVLLLADMTKSQPNTMTQHSCIRCWHITSGCRPLTKRGLVNDAQFPTILNVHEFHLWQLTNTQVIATVHIVVGSHAVYVAIADKLNRFFHEQGISSMTVQPEFCQAMHSTSQCILRCSKAKNCGPLTCCGKHADDDSELRHRKVANQDSGVTQSLLSVPISNTTRASSVINIDSEVLSELGVLKETDL
ncbi:unnamed protein product [Ixodes hexagonus]